MLGLPHMIIIAGHYTVDASERDDVVDAFRDLVARARAMPGCIDLAITADSVDPARINNLEIWEDAGSLDAFRAVAEPPEAPEPQNPTVARYDATDGGPLFP